MDYQPIENYGVIGNLNTVALVGLHGSIDFLCFPEFDSPTIFCSLLDKEKGGSFSITPLHMADVRHKQMYFPDTNILLTRFLSQDGVGEITDFMPISKEKTENVLIRRITQVRGEGSYHVRFSPRFNYARSGHTVKKTAQGFIFTSKKKEGLTFSLSSTASLRQREGDGFAKVTLKPGETVDFVLEQITNEPIEHNNLNQFVSEMLFETMNYWKRWIGRSKYNGRWSEIVNRSALVLKLMTSKQHGSIIAAPTFGLPERIGGTKNWDYRYTWIRDAAFTLYALIRLGYTKEAGSFIQWIERQCTGLASPGKLSLMYSIEGSRKLDEKILKHLEGYKKSKPVRIGNAAYKQCQLDIYGELMDSIYLYNKYGELISYDFWKNLSGQIDWLCDHWKDVDEGIWEVRGGRQHFLYSRIMCWVALDRAVRLAFKRSFPSPSRWEKVRNDIYKSIFKEFWNKELKSFVQTPGSEVIDASALIMPLVRFISPRDPKWLSTLKCIENHLVSDSLVYRYSPKEMKFTGLKPGEGTFSLCSFWYVECLSRSGQIQKARFYFEKMLGYANHLGLYGEQLGYRGEHLGNFPQAFTHLGLISAAYDLNQRLNDEHNRTS